MSSRVLILKEKYARLLDASGNSLQSDNGALNVNLVEGTITSSIPNSTTTVWDTVVFGDGSASEVHDCRTHGKITIFGYITGTGVTNGNCILKVEYSDTSANWYATHHEVMVGTDGVIDGAFEDIAVPYIRLKKQGSGDVSGTVLVSGKGV